MPIPVYVREVEPDREVKTQYELSMAGADQLIAREPALVSWLGKVLGEIRGKTKRDAWPRVFNERKLANFLAAVGHDIKVSVKANESTLPLPREVSDAACCIGKLRGASFLNMGSAEACDIIRAVEQGSPHRR